jgi:hypothetical protein
MSTRIELEHKFLIKNNFKIYELDKIVEMASEILGPQDEFLVPGYLTGNLIDVLEPLSMQENCNRALSIPMLTKDMRARYYERQTGTELEQLTYIFGDFPALAVCFPKYWARAGVTQELKKNLARLVIMNVMMEREQELA